MEIFFKPLFEIGMGKDEKLKLGKDKFRLTIQGRGLRIIKGNSESSLYETMKT